MAATLFGYAIEPPSQIMIAHVLMLADLSSTDVEMESLPTELSLQIAKHLSHCDLKALALTSRHIVGVAQTILLSNVDVSGSHQDVCSFQASVASRPAYFGPMVRRLRFYYNIDQGRLDFHELRRLLRSLPNLRCLHIDVEHYLLFSGNYDRLSDAISNIAGQLTHLQIGRSTNPLKLASTLRRLNSITDLSLDVRSCKTDPAAGDYNQVNSLPIFLNTLSAMSALVRLYIRGPPQFGATFPLKNLLPFAICDILPHTPHLRQLVLHELSRDRGPPPTILLESSSLAQHVSLPTTLNSITWVGHDAQHQSNSQHSANTVRTLFVRIPSLTRVNHHERSYRYVFRRIENGDNQKPIQRRSERLDGISLDRKLEAYELRMNYWNRRGGTSE
ncbi:uncharacterized protein STEHIDRAFT_154997 [Stereum hirsutum FP-91666 SS1]|uniref:uncharacterized protein n=1 Tax=Stereum hirsutum (strain FP-91666) TaxID=721885 RepID=UPI000441031B|nr:uncharacterized protein STEHIDRAFT_154997 [Stereum hirsutum FP-91666 SS1]EIM89319.1 hypothetical protein STEHIDRAFT_154997 [Stereum hirsutum FP-91666 SS1]